MTKLTPTQDLCMDVLLARYRTGENLWTFDSRHRKALEQLAVMGLVNVMNGSVERTVRASLTSQAYKEYIGSTKYTSPLEEKLEEAIKDRDAAVRMARLR